MTNLSRSFVLLVVVIFITALVPIFGCPSPGDGQSNLATRVQALETALAQTQADLAAAEAKLAFVSVKEGDLNGLKGPHFIIEGCNVHIRSGSGDTDDGGELTGRGNLIIGYNEPPLTAINGRLGSHNLVVGKEHEYSNFGGFVAGLHNAVTGPAASVSGGTSNAASGECSSVSGGLFNEAGGMRSSVSGGNTNLAGGLESSVTGGFLNKATKTQSSVSGGRENQASGDQSSVCGGSGNEAGGFVSSVSGGGNNKASGSQSSVSGGSGNEAASFSSSVSGGADRTAADANDWVAGSLTEDF